MAPSDANGVYSLPSGYEAVTGETIQASQHNPPLEDIAAAITQRMMRSGATPMTGPLKHANGSESAPAVTFNSASGTGLYKTAGGVGVSVNGAKVAEFTSSGLLGVRYIGELIPYTGTTAPALTVMPYGQTLNRADYPDLWSFAQNEIAAGNVSYNNGNGTTTFGILDARGRVPAAWDKMGGTAAGRLTTDGSGIDGTIIGSVGGEQSHILTTPEIASHFHSAGISDPAHAHPYHLSNTSNPSVATFLGGDGTTVGGGTNGAGDIVIDAATTGVRVNSPNGLDTTYSAGGGGAHNNTQATFVCNFLLFAGA